MGLTSQNRLIGSQKRPGQAHGFKVRSMTQSIRLDICTSQEIKSYSSEGFTHLWEKGRLDLTVEYVALWPEFSPLFADVAPAARVRLANYGFDCDEHLANRTP